MIFHPLNPLHLALFLGVAAGLVLGALIFHRRADRLNRGRSWQGPLPQLDAFHLAYLADGPSRLSEVRETLRVILPLSRPVADRRAGPVVPPVVSGPPGKRSDPDGEEPIDLETPDDASCLNSLADLGLMRTSDQQVGYGAVRLLLGVLLAQMLIGLLVVAEVRKHLPQAMPRMSDQSDWTLAGLAVGFGLVAMALSSLATRPIRTCAGDEVLAAHRRAADALRPGRRPRYLLTPDELARSVALFGLGPWATEFPLRELHAQLYPPDNSSG